MAGPKQVVCCVCGATVTKSKTLAISGDKRACREHPETATLAEKQQTNRKEAEEIRREKERTRFHPKPKEPSSDLLHPKCMGCNRKGLMSQNYHEMMLYLQSKFEVDTGREFNVLSSEDAIVAYEPLKGLVCIWLVPFDPKIQFFSFNARQAAKMLDFTGLCADCMKKSNIELPMPKLDLRTMFMLGGVIDEYREGIKEKIKAERIQSN